MIRLSLLCCLFLFSFAARAQNGNVGIGTTNPQAQFHTTGSVKFDTLKGTGTRTLYVSDSGLLTTFLPTSSAANGTSTAIPDNSCTGATSTITVTGAETSVPSSGISVKLNITHSYDADLVIFLVSPSGQVLNLAKQVGSSGDNFTNTIFSDGAANSISAGIAPFNGTYRPQGALVTDCITSTVTSFSAFDGGTVNPNGVWTLKIFDRVSVLSGSLQYWEISFAKQPNFAPGYLLKGGVANVPISSSIYDNGKVGIGTSQPLTDVDLVADTFGIRNSSGYDNLWFTVDGPTANINASGADAGLNLRVGNNTTGTYGNSQTLNSVMTLLPGGNVGIGTTTPNALLQFSNANTNRKLVLYEGANNDHQYTGLGLNTGVFRYQLPSTADAHVFYAATGTTASSELLRITGNGRVGISTSAPFSQLSNTSNNIIGSDNNGGNAGSFAWSANQEGYAAQIYNSGNIGNSNGLALKVINAGSRAFDISQGPVSGAGAPLFNVNGNGTIGIGTANPNPGLKLDLVAGSAKNAVRFSSGRGQADNDGILVIQDSSENIASSPNNELVMFTNKSNLIIGTISRNSNANSIAFNTTSDVRLKTGIRPTRYGLRDLMNIQVSDYRYKGFAGATSQTGFLAQQLYKVYPEAVTKGNDADEKQPYMVDYSKLTPLLVKSVQELKAQVDALEKTVKILQQEKQALQAENTRYSELAEQVLKLQQAMGLAPNTATTKAAVK